MDNRHEQIADLDSLVHRIDTPEGRRLALSEIRLHGTPTYGTDPKYPGLIVERQPNGSVSVGKFVNREFTPKVT